jgi:hypothetical protein
MDYVCQGWRIRHDHPFFSTITGQIENDHHRPDENNATELFSSGKHNIVTTEDEVFCHSDDRKSLFWTLFFMDPKRNTARDYQLHNGGLRI